MTAKKGPATGAPPKPKPAPSHAKNADLTPQKTAYVSWLLDTDREPRTQAELAKRLGVDQGTLSDWKRDEFVVGLLKRASEFVEPKWAEVLRTLFLIARDPEHMQCVAAARELGKLLRKYPSEKLEVTTVERVAYVQPGALRDLALEQYPELRPN